MMKVICPKEDSSTGVQLVFVLPRPADENAAEAATACTPKLFVRADELPAIFASEKVAKILARHCLKPVVKSASRLTLYWLGDVVAVADQLRRGEITIDVAREAISAKTTPNTSA
jgi:hypothetical protein